MLFRKISHEIEEYLRSEDDKILVIEGARQIGKTFIVRNVGKQVFKNFVEINLMKDDEGDKLFKNVHRTEDFYLILSSIAGDKLGDRRDTLIFLDEIQHYTQFLTLLKFLRDEHRFRYIACGTSLDVAFIGTVSLPVGSIIRRKLYPLDFEEFLIANGMGVDVIDHMRQQFQQRESLKEELHNYVMNLFKRYLLVGGMPRAVSTFLATYNIMKVRKVHSDIHSLYIKEVSNHENGSRRKLFSLRIYEMVPVRMKDRKKRIVVKDIRGKGGDRFSNYQCEFEFLISSGISLGVDAMSNPTYPLTKNKNLVKLYLNDVGMLTALLYRNDIKPLINDERSIMLGSVYENVVAQQLKVNGLRLFYYDSRSKGKVDFLIDDVGTTSVVPIDVKSGKNHSEYSALNNFLSSNQSKITEAFVLTNDRKIKQQGGVCYIPVYFIMFFDDKAQDEKDLIF